MLTTQAKQLMQQYKTQFMQDCAELTPKLTAFIQEILQGRHWFFRMKTNHLIRRWH